MFLKPSALSPRWFALTRRGGRLSVFDIDWETQFVDSPHAQTTRLITRSFCDSFKNGWIGRQLPRLFKQHGMTDISITPQTIILEFPVRGAAPRWPSDARAAKAGLLSSADLERWWMHLRQAHQADTFFLESPDYASPARRAESIGTVFGKSAGTYANGSRPASAGNLV